MSREDDRRQEQRAEQWRQEQRAEEWRAEQRRQEQRAEEWRAEQQRQEQRAEERRAEERRGEQRRQEQRDQKRTTEHWLNSFFEHSTNAPSSRLPTSHARPGPVSPSLSTSDAGKGTVNASTAVKGIVGVVAITAAAGLLGILKRSFAQKVLGTRPGSQNIPVDKNLLVGRWRSNRDAGIEFGIEFKSDGSYAYIVGEPGRWGLAHIGEYRVRPSRITGEWTNTILVLTPITILSEPLGPFEQSQLEQRRLMDNSPHEYRVRFDPYYRKGEELFLLGVREHAQSTKAWSLYWQGQPRFQRPTL